MKREKTLDTEAHQKIISRMQKKLRLLKEFKLRKANQFQYGFNLRNAK